MSPLCRNLMPLEEALRDGEVSFGARAEVSASLLQYDSGSQARSAESRLFVSCSCGAADRESAERASRMAHSVNIEVETALTRLPSGGWRCRAVAREPIGGFAVGTLV